MSYQCVKAISQNIWWLHDKYLVRTVHTNVVLASETAFVSYVMT